MCIDEVVDVFIDECVVVSLDVAEACLRVCSRNGCAIVFLFCFFGVCALAFLFAGMVA